jgi:hypothetical protein
LIMPTIPRQLENAMSPPGKDGRFPQHSRPRGVLHRGRRRD